jgi:hypothetical protein
MGATPSLAGVLADPRPPRSGFYLLIAIALLLASAATILSTPFITQ